MLGRVRVRSIDIELFAGWERTAESFAFLIRELETGCDGQEQARLDVPKGGLRREGEGGESEGRGGRRERLQGPAAASSSQQQQPAAAAAAANSSQQQPAANSSHLSKFST